MMLSKDMERVKEFKEYIKFLLEIKELGFEVDEKIKQTLNSIHNAMGFLNVEPMPIAPISDTISPTWTYFNHQIMDTKINCDTNVADSLSVGGYYLGVEEQKHLLFSQAKEELKKSPKEDNNY